MATKMSCSWSAENATKAYIRTMNMARAEDANQLNGAEFVSALAAGNNARYTVVACSGHADSITLALAAASHQTGGRVVCILPEAGLLEASRLSLGSNIEFLVGDAQELLSGDYRDADFIAIDCNLENHEEIFKSVQGSGRQCNTVVLGYNAFGKRSWRSSSLRISLLPIGEGLLMTRIASAKKSGVVGMEKRGRFVVKVDKCTGEEHFFRVRSTPRPVIQA
ncbi:unnamed protein product [Cuscuta campestris]|uniref:DUF1442 domain-containing protein n=2 Tax=Cuscuta sect. Cleistogrammica TaxID=1824901 RepID=A0A484NDY5_9ASTE|nr:hypothetical protein DM860_016066 [Cuscuta australis]VFQ99611.1 unnamed protein product [Cuscuta campestris]